MRHCSLLRPFQFCLSFLNSGDYITLSPFQSTLFSSFLKGLPSVGVPSGKFCCLSETGINQMSGLLTGRYPITQSKYVCFLVVRDPIIGSVPPHQTNKRQSFTKEKILVQYVQSIGSTSKLNESSINFVKLEIMFKLH